MVRQATTDDRATLADVLSRAFDDDPVWRALFPRDDRRARILKILFREWLRVLPDITWTTDDLAGGALWAAPGAWRIGLIAQARMAPRLAGPLGTRAIATLGLLAAVEAKHPKKPHHYLRLLGCDPAKQGQGVGSRLLQPVLAHCDAHGEPAYLESSNERNHTFYKRHGFEITEELTTKLGPRIWLMWREPQ
jgi:GNAT superfamily N-acetyltransferase